MRLLRIGLLALPVAVFAAFAAHGTAAVPAHGRCAVRPALAAPSLPAALSARTSCGTFAINSDGEIDRVSSNSQPVPQGTDWYPATGVWTRDDHGRLIVGRAYRTLWRSDVRLLHRRNWFDLSIAVGSHALAFSLGYPKRRLYVAPFGGSARLVARQEYPLGWTSGGFYTWGRAHHRLLLRGADGALRATIAPSLFTYAYAVGRLWFIRNGWLLEAKGARVRRVAALRPLGLWPKRHLSLEPLGRLIGIEAGGRRLVVLKNNGSPFASTSLPFERNRIESVSGPTAPADGTAVAFSTIRADRADDSTPIQRGVETVYILHSGARAGVPVHRERLWFNVCGHGVTLAWHGAWLLYSVGEGPAALIDTSSGRAIEISSVIRRLPGFSGVEESGPLFVGWS